MKDNMQNRGDGNEQGKNISAKNLAANNDIDDKKIGADGILIDSSAESYISGEKDQSEDNSEAKRPEPK
ncbi:hypothetical protein GS399_09760 [Pedobacter sp. HMF7647]|uniref:Uncharacterized protein n=1 Tax=Hufsiella arboris TaxID=2695275 RepID=A0A7K1Y9H8_9SPHI|nr:hypothetical protein [Hufsiella arboris]MXV51253.1 hypothetical protein [Hufsiella arboris]